jgi:hypothetical protein
MENYLIHGLKSGRRRNSEMIFLTQISVDIYFDVDKKIKISISHDKEGQRSIPSEESLNG